MRGKTQWQERPHRIPTDTANIPDICQLCPGYDYLELAWQDSIPAQTYTVCWRGCFDNSTWEQIETNENHAKIEHLTPWRDYEVKVVRQDGVASKVRLFRPAPVPGTVINYLHPKDPRYVFSGKALCSPSIVKLPSGALVASMDVFAGRHPQNLSILFRSNDGGETWSYVCELYPLFWGNLFVHNGRLYAMGCSTEFGDLIIGASDDEGNTWTLPTRIAMGSSTVGSGWQQATMPVLRHRGRLWFAVEYAGSIAGISGISGCIASVAENANLLDPGSWTISEPVAWNPDWPGAPNGQIHNISEGSLIVDRNNQLQCIMRLNADGHDPMDSFAVVMGVDDQNPEAPMTFTRYISIPSGFNSKTYIRYDPATDQYLAIGNVCTAKAPMFQRNVLSLMASPDGIHWRLVKHLLDYRNEDAREVGLQYPSWFIDGDDILLQVRTALNGAANFHDANYSTFHRIRNYRALL